MKATTNYSILLAGTTQHTVMCAEPLLQDNRFSIISVMTPKPKKIGRKQKLTKNPVHVWAEKNNIPVILVDTKINISLKKQIQLDFQSLNPSKHFPTLQQKENPVHSTKTLRTSHTYSGQNQRNSPLTTHHSLPQFLVVVDFGYMIPQWLLDFPTTAPINIHPSKLPKWRGSSPGQFVLLYGEKTSAVSVIKMSKKLDSGDIIYQEEFNVLNTWTQQEYYYFSFRLISEKLPNILHNMTTRTLKPTPQPKKSPTPVARRLKREDGFVNWKLMKEVIKKKKEIKLTLEFLKKNLSPLLYQALTHTNASSSISNTLALDKRKISSQLSNAVRAFTPWPGVWTIVPTKKGDKRMKILSLGNTELISTSTTHIQHPTSNIPTVQLEGLQPTPFNQIKNQIVA